MTISLLDQYSSIGWDFDGVLVDHEYSNLFQDFIKATPEKQHYIITFRTHGMVDDIPYDLARYPARLDKGYFREILNISPEAWLKFEIVSRARKMRHDFGPLTPPEIYYVNWKGMTCSEHDIPVLIDDKTEHVIEGCQKYGIAFLHPDQLGPK